MSIRGVGDEAATRRLMWLFATTIVAPTVLLGLMAIGAFGHQRWSAGDLAVHEVEVQLPVLAELLQTHVSTLPPAEAVDVPTLQAWIADRVGGTNINPVSVEIAGGPPGVALTGPLQGQYLTTRLPHGWKGADQRTLSLVAVGGLLLLAMAGGYAGLSAASREIRMSQRQTELVGRVSHELRTPLTAIRMFVDTLREGRVPPDRAAECLDLLGQETERLSRRIDELLHWASMEAGARRYVREPVPVAEITAEAVVAFRSHVLMDDTSALDLTVELAADLPDLVGDRDAIVEALLNLLANAWRHTKAPRRIVLAARAEGRRIGLSVADSGPGIPLRDRRRIFEKFYLDDKEPPSTHGAGLGLAIVRSIVRAHGGHVDLQSAAGQGSTFTLWFPSA
jgi:signal transduction histidine kinase